MSVTFSVYPLKKEIPTFQQVAYLATKKLNNFLKSYQIDFEAELNLVLVSWKDDIEKWDEVDLSAPAIWDNESEYIWFKVCSFNRGINVHYWELDEREKLDYMEEILGCADSNFSEEKKEEKIELVRRCFENKREWHVKKWANQYWITSVAFGFIASSFAELTDGIIFSSDGGWDYQIFPATAKEFDKVYFRPEKTLSNNRRDEIENFREEILNEIENI